MSLRTDIVNLIINVNGNAAQNQLNELRKKAADISEQMVGLKKGTQEYIAANNNLKTVKAEIDSLKESIGITSFSLKELNAERKKLTAQRNFAAPLSAEFKDYDKQLQAVIARQNELKTGVSGFGKTASSSFASLKQNIVGLAASYIGFNAVIGGVKSLISGSIKLSDQLGDLRRVAGLTADEANNLNDALLNIDTRTSDAGLLSIAIVAGKLGVAKDDIFSFTEAVDKLVVTLGDELGGADEITTQLGKILNVFDGKVTGDNISHLGNAIVDLANKGVATGGYIVDFTQRVSGIAKASNISLGATVGLAAGFEALGLRSESSSTALQKLILSISQNIPKAAKIAGVPLKEFNQLFADKPQEALIKYTEGLVKNKKAFSDITTSFKDAGETGARVVQTILAIGQNGELMREQIDQGVTSIKQLSSLDEGFSIKNNNLAGSLEKVNKQFDKLVASRGVNKFLKGVTDDVNDLFTSITQISNVGIGNAIERAAKGFSILMTQGFAALEKYRKSQKEMWASTTFALPEDTANNKKEPLKKPVGSNKLTQTDTTDVGSDITDSNKTNSQYDQLKKDYENFLKQLDDLKKKSDAGKLSDADREVQQVQDKYNELLKRAADFHLKLNTLDSTYDKQQSSLSRKN